MEQKNRQQKEKAEELLKFPQQVERELKYWLKEKRVSYIERAIKANDVNTRFAGTCSLDAVGCIHPDDEDILDMMLEEDEELFENIAENIELEDDSFAEAG
jgi:hypothetical protein